VVWAEETLAEGSRPYPFGADETNSVIKETSSSESEDRGRTGITAKALQVGAERVRAHKDAIEQEYKRHDSKIHQLNLLLPSLKDHIREFFEYSAEVKSVFIELDDFYHVPRTMQPHVADYVHRLCKDVPLYFKIATLRHATTLYADRGSQPTGAQERHDFQPINVDFTLADFKKTSDQLRQICMSSAPWHTWSTAKSTSFLSGKGLPG
jgi:hypothetical protein